MKIRVIDRILMGLAGLCCVAGATVVIADCLSGFQLQKVLSFLFDEHGAVVSISVAAVLLLTLLIGVAAVVNALRSRKAPHFVQQHTENGDLNIAVSAIDELVRKCVATHDEMQLSDTSIANGKEGLTIGLRLSLGSGVSIPLASAALQKQMKQYITASTGLDVKEVCVQVDTAEAKDIAASSYVMPDMLGKTPVEEHAEVPGYLSADGCNREEEENPIHQRLFSAEEQPVTMPEPPAEIAEEEPEEVVPVVVPEESDEEEEDTLKELPSETEPVVFTQTEPVEEVEL